MYETALGYTDASRMADNACLFKLVAKSIGMKHGVSPTFMAKPWGDVSKLFIYNEPKATLTTLTASWMLWVSYTAYISHTGLI